MFDPYMKYANADTFRIMMGKSITNTSFEDVLTKGFDISQKYESIDFDLTQVEWVSIFELLLLIQWVHLLSLSKKKIRVFLPYTSTIPGIDPSISGLQSTREDLTPMYRRQKASSFLKNIEFNEEIKRLTDNFPLDIDKGSSYEPDQAQVERIFKEERQNPFSARILRLKAFWNEDAISVEGELSNRQLRKMLEEHSCLDPIDSGMLSEVIINELVSNALQHGMGKQQSIDDSSSCAWISARLVKSSKLSIKESPIWARQIYKNLLGRHYMEVAICDTGIGIFQALKDYILQTGNLKRLTVKVILDYAFNKFSSSKVGLRTEDDILPRGLFNIYDLVRQYGGILVLRSSGFYMAYDFLNDKKHPRLIDMYDNNGSCLNIAYPGVSQGGTAIQIILPESKGLFIKTLPQSFLSDELDYPEHYIVTPQDISIFDLNTCTKKIAMEIENLCRLNENKTIFVDLTLFDSTDIKHLYVMARIVRYVIYLENPNLLWLVGPKDCDIFRQINIYLITGEYPDEECGLPKKDLKTIFHGFKPFDRRICPMILPTGKVLWIGASETESIFLKNLWGAGDIDANESGLEWSQIIHLIRANRHLISYSKNKYNSYKKISLQIGNYDCASYLPKIIENHVESLIKSTKGVIHLNGSYHLPHGEYSNYYVYLKPLMSQNGIARQMARYILMKLSLEHGTRDIDLVVGGTHSAKKLINAMADELDAEPLIIDRYTEQIEVPDISNIVRGKRALIVTDVISTGSFVSSIKRKFDTSGCKVEAICCICDIRFPATGTSDPLESLVISLYKFPIPKLDLPNQRPVYEINPISLSPMLYTRERERLSIPSLISEDFFLELLKKSDALIPGHIVLGPTHYTYFVDTKILLDKYALDIFKIILQDLNNELGERKLTLNDISFFLTAEGSNAEISLPVLMKEKIPNARWLQLERIRLPKESTWLLDKIDESYVDIRNIKDSTILILDDGSNTGGTIMQMIKAASEKVPKVILAYCIINRLRPILSSFLSTLSGMGDCRDVKLKFVTDFPIATFIRSNCPICNASTYKVPTDLEDYVHRQKEFATQYPWNHISAARIKETVSNFLGNKRVADLKSFLPHILEVRSRFGVFENRVGLYQEDREELLKLLNNTLKLSAICFVINREQNLLDSMVRSQIPNFADAITKAILKTIANKKNDEILETRDMLEFIAAIRPDVAISNFEYIIDRLITTEDDCLAFVHKITARDELIKIIGYLENMIEKIELLHDGIKFKTYLRGLCNRCLSFYKVEKDRAAITEIVQAILELKIFYAAGGTHEGWKEYGTPLSTILSFMGLPYEARERLFLPIYRDWKEKTRKYLETSLAPNIYAISKIIEWEAGPFGRRYFLNDDYMRDYSNLEKNLSEMKDGKQKFLDNSKKKEIEKIVNRLYKFMFDIATSPIARIVKKIPVYLEKNINERLNANIEWIQQAGISVNQDIPVDLNGLMTVGSFNKILDYIFDNIKKHNFRIHDLSGLTMDSLKGYGIEIAARDTRPDIEIIIRSNGPNIYDGKENQGIRTIRDICQAYDAEYIISNNASWVENLIRIKRWSDDR